MYCLHVVIECRQNFNMVVPYNKYVFKLQNDNKYPGDGEHEYDG